MIASGSAPSSIKVQLPDGSVKEFPADVTPLAIAESISPRLAQAAIAARVGEKVTDLKRPVSETTDVQPVPVQILTEKDAASLGVLRHSCAHLMARAIMRVFPGVQLAFGPTTGNGYYYDLDLPHKLSEDDFARIEAEMQKLVEMAEPFERFITNRDEALAMLEGMGQKLKCEHIQTGLASEATVSFYRQGEFVDLCRGPHIPDAGRIKAFRLLSVAGAYWKGDASGQQLQRVYGTAWFSQKDLDAHLEQVNEAKRRDHRVLGKQLNLFSISPEVGAGLCLWLPKGATVRALLEEFIKGELLKRGYQPVYTPHIGRVELYETSGHFPYYRDSQFTPLYGHDGGQLVDFWIRKLQEGAISEADEKSLLASAKILGVEIPEYAVAGSSEAKIEVLRTWEKQQERYLLKPMNCPHHAQIYKSMQRSYRDLPVRLAEFGTVYRHEQSGELNGMLRVRGLTQDDAHLFCTPEQVEEEFRATLQLVQFVLASVGLEDYRVQLSLRDPKSDKYVGSEENWQRAEASLRSVLTELNLPFTAREGEAAFYGPKADFMVKDCIGREWQLGTVQLDYNLPERFQLEYVGADNQAHRPVMIHRAPFGSMERFTGMLIEHFAGAFPLWLAPEQVRVLSISDKFEGYAREVEREFRAAGFRVTTDLRGAKINGKIRDAQIELIPYMLVVGGKDQENRTVSIRDRIEGDLGAVPLAEAIARLQQEVSEKRIRSIAKPAPAPATSNEGENYAD
ncbi:threonine--tRNA ligase [Planctopirus hydrillae]|uniref:Threonine--tRNA ligase n=1 Tax=Planctopirus hydrillae TaxID=1841610 RepID=A0A1C3E3S9_9PLAN|nr:threonine--tRNA ligase [Planctopirus hydrillae]ODA27902.1 threonine--tRNA ligase [Planctopirus hydrillae]